MGATNIEWTATVNPDGTVTPGKTWNPVTGCTKVSAGCKNCYAEKVAERFWAKQYEHVWDEDRVEFRSREFTDVRCHEDRLEQPLHWKKPSKVFVNSMSDLFHEDVPEDFISKVFGVMAAASWHQFQVLTKRPLRMFGWIESHKRRLSLMSEVWPIPNVWLGVSVENQQTADERIPLLLETPAAIHFVSYEPALAAVDLRKWMWPTHWHWDTKYKTPEEALAAGAYAERQRQALVGAHLRFLDWVIIGGESGPGARPCNLQWVRDVLAQCKAAGVACFMKQVGRFPFSYRKDEIGLQIDDRKGGDMSEWPSDLRVREFPQ